MHILRGAFALLSFCGCWRPSSWTSQSKKFLYTMYMVAMLFLTHSFLIFLTLDLVLNVDNMEDFSANFYLTAEVFGVCWKMRNVIMNYENYTKLIDSLQEKPFAPVSIDETMIRKRFDKLAEWNVVVYSSSVVILLVSMLATTIFKDFATRELTYPLWIPCDYSSTFWFTIVYIYQNMSMLVTSFLNVSCDSLFCGLLIHTCGQLEILRHRLRHIKKNGDFSAEHCARLHNRIYKFGTMVDERFKSTICIQFLVSTSTICVEIYNLTQRGMDSKFIVSVSFTTCVVLQILYYCWNGNEVRLKSLEIPDMIMESDWVSLDNDTRKTFLIIMNRATMPIEIRSVHIAAINLDSFMAIIKTSYSVYNVLLQGQD
ncbi:odorant receptor 10-like [Colletes latitarsis]|uniref:odorant receptor 10-like n=1 Tax=Colletes latitarsis TaxID=2605962 RepID=UPI004036C354